MPFTLNDLTETEFENFCYDLLKSLDFVNLNWRKGTGLSSSPSDQGRDIQGELLKKEFDGNQYFEKWFIECKHYIKGVPPEKLQGALAWANSEKPDVLLIIVSNFLSNPAKNYLDQYQKNNLPAYRIRVWELKDLENLSAEKTEIRIKYGLNTDIEFLPYLNKYHIIYSMKPKLNTVEYFIELMDMLDEEMRDEAFYSIYVDFLRPRFREPKSDKEQIKDLMIGKVDYESFRSKCLNNSKEESVHLVQILVNATLALTFSLGDKTSENYFIEVQENLLDDLLSKIEVASNEDEVKRLEPMIEITKDIIEQMPTRVKRSYEIYNYLCEELVRKLLSETPKIKVPKFKF